MSCIRWLSNVKFIYYVLVAIVAIFMNLGAFLWGYVGLTKDVDYLKQGTRITEAYMEKYQNSTNTINNRLAILETKMDFIINQIKDKSDRASLD